MKTMAYRLTIRYTSAFILFFGLASLLFYLLVTAVLDNQMQEDLKEDIEEFTRFYKKGGLPLIQEEIIKEMLSEDADTVFFAVIDSAGNIRLSSDLATWSEGIRAAARKSASRYGRKPLLNRIETSQKEYRYWVASAPLDSEFLMVLGETTEEQAELLQLLLKVFLGVFVFAIPAAALAGWLLAQEAAKNIQQISQTASCIRRGQFDIRARLETKDIEIQTLIDAFNAMLDRIHDLMKEMRELTDNVAHDMRSPVARIRALSETLLSAPSLAPTGNNEVVIIIKECDQLIQMINATLDVAEAESGTSQFSQERVDMSKLTADACELFETVAEEKAITLVAHLVQGGEVMGNVSALQRMLANVIDNAIKYTSEHGKISVTLEKDEKNIMISVTDTGIGISASDQERIFERFYRCDQSRSMVGCGLGLSYSRAVVQALGGQINVVSTIGKGTCFKIILPATIPLDAAPSH